MRGEIKGEGREEVEGDWKDMRGCQRSERKE